MNVKFINHTIYAWEFVTIHLDHILVDVLLVITWEQMEELVKMLMNVQPNIYAEKEMKFVQIPEEVIVVLVFIVHQIMLLTLREKSGFFKLNFFLGFYNLINFLSVDANENL